MRVLSALVVLLICEHACAQNNATDTPSEVDTLPTEQRRQCGSFSLGTKCAGSRTPIRAGGTVECAEKCAKLGAKCCEWDYTRNACLLAFSLSLTKVTGEGAAALCPDYWTVATCTLQHCALQLDNSQGCVTVEISDSSLQTMHYGEEPLLFFSNPPVTSEWLRVLEGNYPKGSHPLLLVFDSPGTRDIRVSSSVAPMPLIQPANGWWRSPAETKLTVKPSTACLLFCHIEVEITEGTGVYLLWVNGQLASRKELGGEQLPYKLYAGHHVADEDLFEVEVKGPGGWYRVRVGDAKVTFEEECTQGAVESENCTDGYAVGVPPHAFISNGEECLHLQKKLCRAPHQLYGPTESSLELSTGSTVQLGYLSSSKLTDARYYGSTATVVNATMGTNSTVEVRIESATALWPLLDVYIKKPYVKKVHSEKCAALTASECDDAEVVFGFPLLAHCNRVSGTCHKDVCVCRVAPESRRCPDGSLFSLKPTDECSANTCQDGMCYDEQYYCPGTYTCTCKHAPFRQCTECSSPCAPGDCSDDPDRLLQREGLACMGSLCGVDLSTVSYSLAPLSYGKLICPKTCRSACQELHTPMPSASPVPPGISAEATRRCSDSDCTLQILKGAGSCTVYLEMYLSSLAGVTNATLNGDMFRYHWFDDLHTYDWVLVAVTHTVLLVPTVVDVAVVMKQMYGDIFMRVSASGHPYPHDTCPGGGALGRWRVIPLTCQSVCFAYLEILTHTDASMYLELLSPGGRNTFNFTIGRMTLTHHTHPAEVGYTALLAHPFQFSYSTRISVLLSGAYFHELAGIRLRLVDANNRGIASSCHEPADQLEVHSNTTHCVVMLPLCTTTACHVLVNMYYFEDTSSILAMTRQKTILASAHSWVSVQSDYSAPRGHRTIEVSYDRKIHCRAQAVPPNMKYTGELSIDWGLIVADEICLYLYLGWHRDVQDIIPVSNNHNRILALFVNTSIILTECHTPTKHQVQLGLLSESKAKVAAQLLDVDWYAFSGELLVTHDGEVLVSTQPPFPSMQFLAVLSAVPVVLGVSAYLLCKMRRKRMEDTEPDQPEGAAREQGDEQQQQQQQQQHQENTQDSRWYIPPPRVPLPQIVSPSRQEVIQSVNNDGSLQVQGRGLPGEVDSVRCIDNTEEIPSMAVMIDPAAALECCVCLTNAKSTVLIPCRHLCVCGGCAEKVQYCPLCRERVEQRMGVWM